MPTNCGHDAKAMREVFKDNIQDNGKLGENNTNKHANFSRRLSGNAENTTFARFRNETKK